MSRDVTSLFYGKEVYIYVSLILYNGIAFRLPLKDTGKGRLIAQGILFEELSSLSDQLKEREELTQKQLKALADPMRMAIIRQLSSGPRYGKELSDRLGITPATLSHHLNLLMMGFFIEVEVRGRKSYYTLNVKELKCLAEDIMQLARNCKEEI